MLLSELEALAEKEFVKYGLPDWKLVVGQPPKKLMLGQCRYSRREIFVHEELLSHGTEEAVLDTFYHELAHALTPGDGHGNKWRAMARSLGAIPKSTCNLAALGITLPSVKAAQEARRMAGSNAVIRIATTNNSFSFIRGTRSPIIGIHRCGIKTSPTTWEAIGDLYNVPMEAWLNHSAGILPFEDLYGIALGTKEYNLSKAKPKSTYSTFTRNIYRYGMPFAEFEYWYRQGKPEASSNTIKAQYYRVVKELGDASE